LSFVFCPQSMINVGRNGPLNACTCIHCMYFLDLAHVSLVRMGYVEEHIFSYLNCLRGQLNTNYLVACIMAFLAGLMQPRRGCSTYMLPLQIW
jgi:hypothetical protein